MVVVVKRFHTRKRAQNVCLTFDHRSAVSAERGE